MAMQAIILIVCFFVSSIIVNQVQKMYMRFIGADAMFFSGKSKIIAIIVVTLFLTGLGLKIFGLAS